MQRRGAGGRVVNGGAVAYELRGVYPMNEKLNFEEKCERVAVVFIGAMVVLVLVLLLTGYKP